MPLPREVGHLHASHSPFTPCILGAFSTLLRKEGQVTCLTDEGGDKRLLGHECKTFDPDQQFIQQKDRTFRVNSRYSLFHKALPFRTSNRDDGLLLLRTILLFVT